MRSRSIPEDEISEETSPSLTRTAAERDAPLKDRPSFIRGSLLTIARIALCLLILGFAFTARAIGGAFYADTASWYFDRFNSSVLTEGKALNNTFTDEVSIRETSLKAADSTAKSPQGKSLPLSSGTITSPYGQRDDETGQQFHKGIDIAADKNSEIMAILDGEVTTADTDPSYGNYIILTHSDGSKTLYAHCEKLTVSTGELVKAGSVIALVGSTGDSDGPHLHLELIRDGQNADPSPLLGDAYK